VPVWSEDRGAERVEVWEGVGMGYLSPQLTRGRGECRELPQWGPGAESWPKTILVRSEGARTAFVGIYMLLK